MYIKIASIIEILLGLAIGGFVGFVGLLSRSAPGPAAAFGVLVFGTPIILLGILLIIFGINLWKLKKWAWLASIVVLVIVIALFTILWFYTYPIFSLYSASAIICLILLILGRKNFPK